MQRWAPFSRRCARRTGRPFRDHALCRVDDVCAVSSVRTNETRSRGVNDPLPKGLGTGFGGWQRGSLTPPMPASLLPTAALSATRAAQSAARCSAAKSHTGTNIAESTRLAATLTRRRGWKRNGSPGRGTLLPSLCSPIFRDIHTQFAYTRCSGVHRGPHLYRDSRGLPGGR